MHALSLSKMAKKAPAEDEDNALLRKHIAELEEANTRLEESNAEMCLTVGCFGDAVTMVQHELDDEIARC
jgi:hypothetical protein